MILHSCMSLVNFIYYILSRDFTTTIDEPYHHEHFTAVIVNFCIVWFKYEHLHRNEFVLSLSSLSSSSSMFVQVCLRNYELH